VSLSVHVLQQQQSVGTEEGGGHQRAAGQHKSTVHDCTGGPHMDVLLGEGKQLSFSTTVGAYTCVCVCVCVCVCEIPPK